MPLNNSEYCIATNSTCCKSLQVPSYSCGGIEYSYYCEDQAFFQNLAAWVEIPIEIVDLILSCAIIFISIFGRMDGSFKWCILNISIFHFFHPIFVRLIHGEILIPMYQWSGNKPSYISMIMQTFKTEKSNAETSSVPVQTAETTTVYDTASTTEINVESTTEINF
ncbi:hypothetical protein DdX_18698 [Ditylenchus destructor]|uniref:Uncharacterized protein n=1 Tax=Ditylenchus destructor TaxID=166010 RepID=A0AAD4MJR3_9BILA|nr:hypothetical protein DdX_18698 [Ditylenchus destructor]